MTTVRDIFAKLERQCLGLKAFCIHGSFLASHAQPNTPLIIIQYEITGPGGGTWHLTLESDDCWENHGVDWDDCELREGPIPEPDVIVRASVEDWLALWDRREQASALLDSGRISVAVGGEFTEVPQIEEEKSIVEVLKCLPFLGVLGPLRELGEATLSGAPQWRDPPDVLRYPPWLDDVRFTWVPWRLPVQVLDEGEPRHDARALVASAVRLSSTLRHLFGGQIFLIQVSVLILVSVLVGVGIDLVFGWHLTRWTWVALLLSLLLSLFAWILYRSLQVRLRILGARILRRARESPRALLLLLEANLIDRGK